MHLHNGSYRFWVRDRLGTRRRVSTETNDPTLARQVEAWTQDLYARMDRHGVLTAICRGDVGLVQAFVMGEMDTAKALDEARKAACDTVITDAMLDAWGAWVQSQRAGAETAARYRIQIDTLWPAPRRRSWLIPQNITPALDALPCSDVTKGRYKAALGSLCQYLVRQGVLDFTPMPSVASYPQPATKTVEWTRAEALAVLHALPPIERAVEGLMWACGWELSAILHATVGDINLTAGTAYARGTKTATRARLTVFTEPEPMEWVKVAMRDKLPTAKLFPEAHAAKLLRAHRRACDAAGVAPTTLHDWRHIFAVKEIRAGKPLHFIAKMLGHANTTLLQNRYGLLTLHEAELQAFGCRPLNGPQVVTEAPMQGMAVGNTK